jgi:hypothetical protein
MLDGGRAREFAIPARLVCRRADAAGDDEARRPEIALQRRRVGCRALWHRAAQRRYLLGPRSRRGATEPGSRRRVEIETGPEGAVVAVVYQRRQARRDDDARITREGDRCE